MKNTPYFFDVPGGMQSGEARMSDINNDGLIDVVAVNKEANRFQLLQLLSRLSDGSHIKSKYVHYFQAKSVQLIPEIHESVNIDGDVKHNTPVKISVLKKKLPIFY